MKRRIHKSVTILSALLKGIPITKDDRTWFIDKGRLYIEATCEDTLTGTTKKVNLGVNFSLEDFIKLADRFTEDELFIISSTVVLNEVKRGI